MIKIFKIIFLISAVLSVGLLLVSSQAVRYDCFTIYRVDKQDRNLIHSEVADYNWFFFYRANNRERFSGLLHDVVINGYDASINRRDGVDYLRTYFDNTPSYIIQSDNRQLFVTQCGLKGIKNETQTKNSKS